MRVGFVDASCVVAVAFGEPGLEELAARLRGLDRLFASNLLEAEVHAAFEREGSTFDGTILRGLSWVLPDRPLSGEIRAVLKAGYLRGPDLWHLACALYLSPDPRELPFLTMDRQQAAAASTLGFPGLDALELDEG